MTPAIKPVWGTCAIHKGTIPVIKNAKTTSTTSDDTINPKKNAHTSKSEEILSDDFIPQQKAVNLIIVAVKMNIIPKTKQLKLLLLKCFLITMTTNLLTIFEHDRTASYHCSFRIKLQSELREDAMQEMGC